MVLYEIQLKTLQIRLYRKQNISYQILRLYISNLSFICFSFNRIEFVKKKKKTNSLLRYSCSYQIILFLYSSIRIFVSNSFIRIILVLIRIKVIVLSFQLSKQKWFNCSLQNSCQQNVVDHKEQILNIVLFAFESLPKCVYSYLLVFRLNQSLFRLKNPVYEADLLKKKSFFHIHLKCSLAHVVFYLKKGIPNINF